MGWWIKESEGRYIKIDRVSIGGLPRQMVAAQVQTIRQTHQFGDASLGGLQMDMEFRAEGRCIAFQELPYIRKEPLDREPRKFERKR